MVHMNHQLEPAASFPALKPMVNVISSNTQHPSLEQIKICFFHHFLHSFQHTYKFQLPHNNKLFSTNNLSPKSQMVFQPEFSVSLERKEICPTNKISFGGSALSSWHSLQVVTEVPLLNGILFWIITTGFSKVERVLIFLKDFGWTEIQRNLKIFVVVDVVVVISDNS